MAELSIKRRSFLIFDQFFNSLCNPHSFKWLTVNGKVIALADCLHLVDWGGTGLVLQAANHLGVKLPLGTETLDLLFSTVNLGWVHEDEGCVVFPGLHVLKNR